MILSYLYDTDHENMALYLDDKLVVDYDDYVNLETAIYTLRALDLEFDVRIYEFSSDEIGEQTPDGWWEGFPPNLSDMIDNLTLKSDSPFTSHV
jgi:hypothetical protein